MGLAPVTRLEPGTNIRVAVIINTPPDVGLDVNCIYRFLPIYGRSQTPFSELADAPLDGEGPPNEATIQHPHEHAGCMDRLRCLHVVVIYLAVTRRVA